MDKKRDLDALATALASIGSKLAVANPGSLDAVVAQLRELGRDLVSAAEALGYAGGTGGRYYGGGGGGGRYAKRK